MLAVYAASLCCNQLSGTVALPGQFLVKRPERQGTIYFSTNGEATICKGELWVNSIHLKYPLQERSVSMEGWVHH